MRIRRGAAGSTTAVVAVPTSRRIGLWAVLGALLLSSGALFAIAASRSHGGIPNAKTVHVLGESIKTGAATTCSTGAFCISGDVSDLAPAQTKSITLTLTNPNPFPIYVTQLGGTAGAANGCDGASNLTLNSWSVTGAPNTIPAGAITIGPATSSGFGSATTQNVTVMFNDLGATPPQDSCLNNQIPLTYSGQAMWYGNCITGKQSGGVVVHSGDIVCLTTPANVTGGITVASGGTLIVSPGSNITGGVKSAGGASMINLCGASVSGGVDITGATGPVWIGATNYCPGNTITGGLTLTSNTGGVQIVGNNISGGMSCSSNNPAPSGSGNKVSGKRAGQCAGSF